MQHLVQRSLLITLAALLITFAVIPAQAAEIDIPYEKFVLDNGLTLIVHEDHKAPIVAVNLWYHVGSKNEVPGKTGFAHLFEHLMFNGSENFDDDYFQAMQRIGATDLNGTTWLDRTNYFQNVPTSAIDVALWMESDRMGHLLGAITQEKLDEQRGVVQNEKRQGENQPYALSDELIQKACFPSEHPYSWTTIGSMEDLDAASLDDVKEWFKTYYGPNNTVLAIAGDITPTVALKKVKKYFGDIPSGPPIAKQDKWIAKRTETHRQIAEDRVPQARLYRVWNIAEWGSADASYLDLVSDVLASGKNSRLYKRLVYDDQIATDISAYIQTFEIAGIFQVEATAKAGVELSLVEKVVDEELQRFLKEGPTEKELRRFKSQYKARFIRGIERIGGFGGKSDILARNTVYGGTPDYYKKTLATIKNATAADLLSAAQRWLSDGDYVLEIHPYVEGKASEVGADRSKLPDTDEPPLVSFPTLQRAELSNGLKIVLAERHDVPIIDFRLLVDAGYAADQFAAPGTARLAMDVMDEGTATYTSLEINEKLQELGATLSTGASLDVSTVRLNTLTEQLQPSLDLFSDVVLNPSFPDNEFQRLQKQSLARIQREKSTPIQMALRVFPGLLYGDKHAYGLPLTGSGTEASVQGLKKKDLTDFHKTWFKPNNATLVITGDVKLKEIQPKLEKLFKGWKKGKMPTKNIATVADKDKSVVYIVDRPGSKQSIIFAGHLAPPRNNNQEEEIQMMNNILGGNFTSRINMNLREDKHWTYGAQSFIWGAKGQRPFIAYSPVQSDKTADSMQEILNELNGVIGVNPPTEDELEKNRLNELLGLPGNWETISSVAGSASEVVQYGLPDDYFKKYAGKIQGMKLADVKKATGVLKPNNLVWVIVGDKAQIEEAIKAKNFGVIKYIDADGNAI
jgi:zinc protease